MKQQKGYFTLGEKLLWSLSVLTILGAFFLFDQERYLTLIASLLGVTSLIFNAKGNPVGQVLMIIFSLLYGIISYGCSYYGEMITYLGMTAPMAMIALISWLNHPYRGNQAEVEVGSVEGKEQLVMWSLTFGVTVGFYFILKAFDTANLSLSTLSVTTSFLAVYLTFRRSPYFAIAYAANNIVLIVLWVLVARGNPSYCSVIVCFFAFLVNDLYGFWNWKRMEENQKQNKR